MERSSRSPTFRSLSTRAISYQYRYCPRCGVEWPASCTSRRECAHWLGDHPLVRTEWQVAPAAIGASASESYEMIFELSNAARLQHLLVAALLGIQSVARRNTEDPPTGVDERLFC